MTTEARRQATKRYRQTDGGREVFREAKARYHAKEERRVVVRQQQQARREAFRDWLAELKSIPCMDCGGTFPPVAMDFDHVRGVKVKAISLMYFNSKQRVLDELKKCEVVCSNCHRVRTYNRLRGEE